MGGAAEVLRHAHEPFGRGEYRWAAMLLADRDPVIRTAQV